MAFLLGECLLLQLLEEKGLSQAEFARLMNCSRQYIHQLTTGEHTMSLEFAINAANILGCKVTELYSLIIASSRKE